VRFAAFFLLLTILGCGAGERAASQLLKEVSAETREKARVQVIVKASAEEPSPEDLVLRKAIEDRVEAQGIGRLISSGAGAGQIDVTIEVDNTAEAIPRVREILRLLEVLPRSSFRVLG